ncbi:LppX_LprAFG lipoprotein [Demetria terragena]|uniref:LppX_LprAFG lipoprotein n=1 Tax=Demetria terragena TaxID=63959 RepID=UPI000363710E|nr:LppX_LprAFG lipoprotein [Demetria terragena]
MVHSPDSTPPISRRAALAALPFLGVVSLGACSSGADSRKDEAKPSGSKAPTPKQRLQATKKVMDASSGMHLTLTSKGVPDSATGVIKGEGDGGPAPAFKGTLTAAIAGTQADVPVVAVDGKVWAKLPIWPDMRTVQPKDYGAPDPALLFSREKGISSLLPKTKNPKFGAERRDGNDVVRVITGELIGTDVVATFSLGNPGLKYDVTYLVTSKNELRSAALRGVFFNDATTTYTLRLDEYGKKIDVQPPA